MQKSPGAQHRLIIILAVAIVGIFGLVSPVLLESEEESIPEIAHEGVPAVPLDRVDDSSLDATDFDPSLMNGQDLAVSARREAPTGEQEPPGPGEGAIPPVLPQYEESESAMPGEERIPFLIYEDGKEERLALAGPEEESILGTAREVKLGPLDPPRQDPELGGTVRYPSVLDHNLVLGYYGNPNSTRMGILGEQDIAATAEILALQARDYAELLPGRGTVGAFHLIYATVWPDANLGRLRDEAIQAYIDFAKEEGMIVILDHQLGRHAVEDSIRELLPYLSLGPVHLAIDPEWRTLRPGLEIGEVDASEINAAQNLIQEYLDREGIEERRMLIVHQFKPKMIQNRDEVLSDFPKVDLVLNADGFGPPGLKLSSWQLNASADNFPYKGFKLFYPKDWKSVGFDSPLMSPEEVLNLEPQPVYINYQ